MTDPVKEAEAKWREAFAILAAELADNHGSSYYRSDAGEREGQLWLTYRAALMARLADIAAGEAP